MKNEHLTLTKSNLKDTGLCRRELNMILADHCYIAESFRYIEEPEYPIEGFTFSIEFDVFILGTDLNVDWSGVLIVKTTEKDRTSTLYESNLALIDWSLIQFHNKNWGRIAQNHSDGMIEKSQTLPADILDWLTKQLKDYDHVQIIKK